MEFAWALEDAEPTWLRITRTPKTSKVVLSACLHTADEERTVVFLDGTWGKTSDFS